LIGEICLTFFKSRGRSQGKHTKFATHLVTGICNPMSMWTLIVTPFVAMSCNLGAVSLGAFLGDLLATDSSGQAAVPQKISAAAVSWVEEGVAPSESHLTMGQISFNAKTVGAYTDLTRTMWKSGTPDFESVLIDDLVTSIGVEIDRAGLNGLGRDGQPLGLLQSPNPTGFQLSGDTGNGAEATYADLCEMERIVGAANGDAAADARLAWVTSPAGRSKLRRTDLGGATTTGRYVRRHDNTLLGSPAYATSSVPSDLTEGSGSSLSALLYGNFKDLYVQLFSAVDLLINPYLQSVAGVIRCSAFQDLDIRPRHYNSFVRAVGMVTS
jgi:HK97 family phage major capsid protein